MRRKKLAELHAASLDVARAFRHTAELDRAEQADALRDAVCALEEMGRITLALLAEVER